MGAFDDREQKDAAVKMVGELDAEIVVLKAERDAALAVSAAAKEFAENTPHGQHGDYGPPIVFTEDLHRLLDQSPADALAEHDAEVAAKALDGFEGLVTNSPDLTPDERDMIYVLIAEYRSEDYQRTEGKARND